LHNEAANHRKHQEHDKYFENSEAPHGASRIVKNKNNDDIDRSECASSDQRYFKKKIEGNCRTGDLSGENMLERSLKHGSGGRMLTSAMSVAMMADSAKM
jgi:hypothetical protein